MHVFVQTQIHKFGSCKAKMHVHAVCADTQAVCENHRAHGSRLTSRAFVHVCTCYAC